MNCFQQELASLIRNRRQDMGMSQEELADRIDKTTGFIGQLERGESQTSLETFQALVHCLGIDANSLLSGQVSQQKDISEVCILAEQMDETKRLLLLEFARMLHRLTL